MSGKDFGGRMTVVASSGERISMRGTFNLMPTNASAEGVTNQDGSLDRVMTPTSFRAELAVVDKNVDFNAMISGPRRNFTIVEDHTGVTHYFTDAFMTGQPSVNRLTGEVTGIALETDSYRKAG